MWTNCANERTGYFYHENYVDSLYNNGGISRSNLLSRRSNSARNRTKSKRFRCNPLTIPPPQTLSTVSTNLVANNRRTRVIGDDYLQVTFPLPPPSPAPATTNSQLRFPDFNNLLHGLRFKKLANSKISALQPVWPVDSKNGKALVHDDADDDDYDSTHHSHVRRARRLLFSHPKIKPRRRRMLPLVPKLTKLKISPYNGYSASAASTTTPHSAVQYSDDDIDLRQAYDEEEIAQGGSSSCFVRENLLSSPHFSSSRVEGSGVDDDDAIDLFYSSHNNKNQTAREVISCNNSNFYSDSATATNTSTSVDMFKAVKAYYSEEDNYYSPTTNATNDMNDLMRRGVSTSTSYPTPGISSIVPKSILVSSANDRNNSDECQISHTLNSLCAVTSLSSNRVVKFDTTLSVIINDQRQSHPFKQTNTNDRLTICDSKWV